MGNATRDQSGSSWVQNSVLGGTVFKSALLTSFLMVEPM